jgi:hypothetical protein
MMINDFLAMLAQVPPMIAGGWGVWLTVGLLLSIWGRREGKRMVVHAPTTRQKSGVRPPAAVPAPRPAKAAVLPSASDAFGELEALLEPHMGTHRTPGDSPVLTEPLRTPALSAPQSLP